MISAGGTVGVKQLSAEARPVKTGLQQGTSCSWVFSRPSSFLQLVFDSFDMNGPEDTLQVFFTAEAHPSSLVANYSMLHPPPRVLSLNETQARVVFTARSPSKQYSPARGIVVHAHMLRTWFVGPVGMNVDARYNGTQGYPFPTMRMALLAAESGDTIALYPGRYTTGCGHIVSGDTVLHIKGLAAGAEFTIIDCGGEDAFYVHGSGTLTLSELTVRNSDTVLTLTGAPLVTLDNIIMDTGANLLWALASGTADRLQRTAPGTTLIVEANRLRVSGFTSGARPTLLDVAGPATLELTDVRIEDCVAAATPLVNLRQGTNMTLRSVTLRDCHATRSNLLQARDSVVEFHDANISDTSAFGAALLHAQRSRVELDSVYITSCRTSDAGFAAAAAADTLRPPLLLAAHGEVQLRDVTVQASVVSQLRLSDCDTTLSRVELTGDPMTAGTDPAAILPVPAAIVSAALGVGLGSALSVERGSLAADKLSLQGHWGLGAAWLRGVAPASLVALSAANNVALASHRGAGAGALNIDLESTVDLTGAVFAFNSGRQAGSLWVAGGSRVADAGATYTSSIGGDGGAVHAMGLGTEYNLTQTSTLLQCSARRHGGCIRISAGAKALLQDVSVTRGTAAEGGCIMADGGSTSVVLRRVSLTRCAATSGSGGAVAVLGFARACIAHSVVSDTSAVRGGGVAAVQGAVVGIVDVSISNATASTDGGAIYVAASDFAAPEATAARGECAGLVANPSLGSPASPATDWYQLVVRFATAAERGGAVFADHSVVRMAASSMQDCSAGGEGGALGAVSSTVTMEESTALVSCAAGRLGGGVWSSAAVIRARSQTAITKCSAGERGGGVFAADRSSIELDRTDVLQCSAAGGVEMDDDMGDAGGGGGGLALEGGSKLRATYGSWSFNAASQGGAVAARDATIELFGVALLNNTASEGSGGALVSNYTRLLNVSGCMVFGNSALLAGGGVSVFRADRVDVTYCHFEANAVGRERDLGPIETPVPVMPLAWNVTNDTRATPSIQLLEQTTLEPLEWPVRGGALAVDFCLDSEIQFNEFVGNEALSAGLGGALYTRSERLVFIHNQVTDNYADGFGGGIADWGHEEEATWKYRTISNSTVTRNHARGGGGGLFWHTKV